MMERLNALYDRQLWFRIVLALQIIKEISDGRLAKAPRKRNEDHGATETPASINTAVN